MSRSAHLLHAALAREEGTSIVVYFRIHSLTHRLAPRTFDVRARRRARNVSVAHERVDSSSLEGESVVVRESKS
ncbi:MAG TPA: hypothetical protein VFQ35_24350 [Polyangiaceae bacterium]|nr:hypothetical protein [Polyangiaceae bacterium]